MNEFILLRQRARERRDREYAKIRDEYENTLRSIAALEQDLLGRESSRHKTLSSCIDRCIPSDREFTTLDIFTALEALDPGRVWRKRSIDSHQQRLRERGIVRRRKRSQGPNAPAIYIRADVAVEPMPFEDMTLAESVASILTKPMRQTEIVVALFEAGYHTMMTKKALRNAVGQELQRGAFVKEGDGKWHRDLIASDD